MFSSMLPIRMSSMGQPKRKLSTEYSLSPPLGLEADYWVYVQNEAPKSIMGKWIIVLLGPHQKTGAWRLITGSEQSHESLWEWGFNKPQNEKGSWYFSGRRPEFQNGRWMFVSERPELFYMVDKKVVAKRFGISQDGSLALADNSQNSMKFLSDVNEGQTSNSLIAVGAKSGPGVDEDGFYRLAAQNFNRSSEFRDRIEKKLNQRSETEEQSLFNPVSQKEEWQELMSEGAMTDSTAEIWTVDKKHKLEAKLKQVNQERNFFLTRSGDEKEVQRFLENIAKLEDSNCLFSVNLHHVQLFFVTSMKGYHGDDVKFDMPTMVFEVQRRLSLRYSFPPNVAAHVEFNHPREPGARIIKNMSNVSSGGLNFFGETGEQELFKTGTELGNIKFSVASRVIKTSGIVKHAAPVVRPDGQPCLKVGVQFKKLRPSDHHYLGYFVHEQIFNYLTRLRGNIK
jgi:hypothetical protein